MVAIIVKAKIIHDRRVVVSWNSSTNYIGIACRLQHRERSDNVTSQTNRAWSRPKLISCHPVNVCKFDPRSLPASRAQYRRCVRVSTTRKFVPPYGSRGTVWKFHASAEIFGLAARILISYRLAALSFSRLSFPTIFHQLFPRLNAPRDRARRCIQGSNKNSYRSAAYQPPGFTTTLPEIIACLISII